MGAPTTDQVNVMLQLYDLRREAKLREARDWYFSSFNPTSVEDGMRMAGPGTKENAYMRMVISYWDMAANLCNRGLVDEELFFESTGEQWMVWERLKPVVAAWRGLFKNPLMFSALEEHVGRLEAWREKRAPGNTQAMREFMAQMAAQAGQAKASAAGR